MIALVLAGTAYISKNVFDVGNACPKTLYVVAICFPYNSDNKNGCIESAVVLAVILAVVLILPLASIVILVPAIKADTTLELVKYKLPDLSATFAVVKNG
jgi:hypothetical protein